MGRHHLKFGELLPGNSRDDRAYLRSLVRHGQKLAYIVEYFQIYWTDSPYESALRADNGSVPYFQFVKGRCHGNQIILRMKAN